LYKKRNVLFKKIIDEMLMKVKGKVVVRGWDTGRSVFGGKICQ
jgi:hypothetical protein